MVTVKRLIFDNFLIKIVSFLVAIGLWLYVTSKGDLEVSFMVPLELQNVPPSMIVISDVPDYVNVRLKGRQSAIRGMDAPKIHVAVDLSESRVGDNSYPLMEASVQVPSAVEVAHITPRTVTLRLARLEQKEVILRAETNGLPAPGYRVTKVVVTPPRLKIEGPEYEIRRMTTLPVPSIRLSGEKEGFIREVRLEEKYQNVRLLDHQTVLVTVVIKKRP